MLTFLLSSALAAPVVYGFLPSWQDVETDVPYEHLTHVAIFEVTVDGSGTLTGTSHWRETAPVAVADAAPHGVKVHLCLAIFDEAKQRAALATEAKRVALADALEAEVVAVGADGVNLDIEFAPGDLRQPLIDLTTDLKSRGLEVTLALPLVDWSDAYDYGQLAALSDGLFIMGYDAHWAGGSAGPVAPLWQDDIWGWITLEWAVEDYLDLGATEDKVWLGLPLYGRGWTVADSSEVPASATYSTTGSVFYAEAMDAAATHGRQWDEASLSPWYAPSATEQVWYDDDVSLGLKMEWALLHRGLGGIGFWALGYEAGDPVLWQAVDDVVDAASVPDEQPGGGDDGGGSGDAPGDGGDDTGPEGIGSRAPGDDKGGCQVAPVGGGLVWLGLALVVTRRRAAMR